MIRWPWQRRPATLDWAREVVAKIPAEDLTSHILSFAEGMARDRNPVKVAQHRAKLVAACERVDELLANPVVEIREITPEESAELARRWQEAHGCPWIGPADSLASAMGVPAGLLSYSWSSPDRDER